MLSRDKFYGGAYGIPSGSPTLRKGAPRVIDISAVENGTNAASVTLPNKSLYQPGGPAFFFVNNGPRTIGLKDGGSTFWNVPPGGTATVVLGTTRWWAFMDVTGTAKPVATNGNVVRTVPVGYVVPPTTVTQPTAYDPILCDGGYRRARLCGPDGGAYVNIWMLDADVDPHFVDGVAIFKYQDVCYYFKQSDRLQVNHGFTLAGSDVTWFATCDLCTTDGGGPPPDPPVPCTLPTGLSTAYSVDFHHKLYLSGVCPPDCESDLSETLTQVSPGVWRCASYSTCLGQTMPYSGSVAIEMTWVNPGDGSPCYWELFFTDGVAACRSVFRKFTGLTPIGGDWAQVDPFPLWVCPGDGLTHNVCIGADNDSITSPVVG
jgi:hypothetical protein